MTEKLVGLALFLTVGAILQYMYRPVGAPSKWGYLEFALALGAAIGLAALSTYDFGHR